MPTLVITTRVSLLRYFEIFICIPSQSPIWVYFWIKIWNRKDIYREVSAASENDWDGNFIKIREVKHRRWITHGKMIIRLHFTLETDQRFNLKLGKWLNFNKPFWAARVTGSAYIKKPCIESFQRNNGMCGEHHGLSFLKTINHEYKKIQNKLMNTNIDVAVTSWYFLIYIVMLSFFYHWKHNRAAFQPEKTF